jgi:hypothetical protein
MSLDSSSAVRGDAAPSAEVARPLGADAFAFGFPLLMTMATMRRATNVVKPSEERAPLNQFAHLHRFPDPAFKAIVSTNAHTLYSLAWLDLSAEPLLLDLPDTGGRSYLMPLMDAWTDVFICLGPRTIGTASGTYALAGPGWSGSLPDGVRRIDAPTNTVWMIGHTHATGRGDIDFGLTIQAGMRLTPLSAHGSAYTPPDGTAEAALDSGPSPHRMLRGLGAEEFLSTLAWEMTANPPASGDRQMLDRLATLGLRPGQPFVWATLPDETREALEAGIDDGRAAVDAPPPPRLENGWQSLRERLGTYGADYLRRAQIANVALGIAHPEDAIFPLTACDADGDRLNGAHRYVLRFEPGGLPPVGALWSLALYDMDQLPVENPIDRYALGDRDDLELGPDGSLEIAIQHGHAGESDANWLPAPEGDFNLMLHMYWPTQRVLDGTWAIPPVRRVA